MDNLTTSTDKMNNNNKKRKGKENIGIESLDVRNTSKYHVDENSCSKSNTDNQLNDNNIIKVDIPIFYGSLMSFCG